MRLRLTCDHSSTSYILILCICSKPNISPRANGPSPKTKYGGLDETHLKHNAETGSDHSSKRTSRKNNASLLMALVRTLGAHYASVGLYVLAMDVAVLLNPLILR
jgi:hypothetical protein